MSDLAYEMIPYTPEQLIRSHVPQGLIEKHTNFASFDRLRHCLCVHTVISFVDPQNGLNACELAVCTRGRNATTNE
jgi:hypothetical protein